MPVAVWSWLKGARPQDPAGPPEYPPRGKRTQPVQRMRMVGTPEPGIPLLSPMHDPVYIDLVAELLVSPNQGFQPPHRPAVMASRRAAVTQDPWRWIAGFVLSVAAVSTLCLLYLNEPGVDAPARRLCGGHPQSQHSATAASPLARVLLHHPQAVGTAVCFLTAAVLIGMMFPPGGAAGSGNAGGGGGRNRQPPSWSPEKESQYPFRHWMQDLLTWSILATDLDASQQAAAIIMQLGGAARDLVRNLSYQEITTGGILNGMAVDPVTYLTTQLAMHFAPWGEEVRLTAMSELMNFHRMPHESTDALLSRFLTLRHKAQQNGAGLTMTWEGYSWLLLRACGANAGQLINILQPFQGRFPSSEAEFQSMSLTLRRMGHILEHTPMNIASRLRSAPTRSFFEHTSGAYVTQESEAVDPWNSPGADPWAQGRDLGQTSSYWEGASVSHGTQAAPDSWGAPSPAPRMYALPYEESGTDTDTRSSFDDGAMEDTESAGHDPC